jgi:cyclic pyranopterin phosphate synthase
MDEKDIDYSSEFVVDDEPGPLPPDFSRKRADVDRPQVLPVVERLSHYDAAGQAHMVDVSAKAETRREAVAAAFVELSDAVLAALPSNPKGNPLEVARFAGIQAAKQTANLIPMCHPLALSFVDVRLSVVAGGVAVEATAATVAGTGVEMEAMVAASIAALTVYDMTKALDKGIRIREVVLVRKSGGKSGDYLRK